MDPKPLLLALALGLATPLLALPRAASADDPLADALEAVVKQQVAAFNAKNLHASMATIHAKSPEYEPTEGELGSAFKDEKLTASLVSFRYVGHDDEFAVARVKVKVTAPGTPDFQDNVVDTLAIFHQEGGRWKLWDVYVLGASYVE